MIGKTRFRRLIRICGAGVAIGVMLAGNSAAFEADTTFDIVYDKNNWTALCPTNTAPDDPCSIGYSINTEGRFVVLYIEPTSLQFYSYELSELIRFQVGTHLPIGVSCSGRCVIAAEQLRKLHADMMDGSTMTIESASLWSPHKSVNISVAEYREAFAATVKWNETH